MMNEREAENARGIGGSRSAYDGPPVDADVPCPLCDYNLRGAAEARCPECGFRFEWRDLRDPERRRHEYLFEHHPRRNLWSFRKTVTGALRPRRFWRTLRPGQPSNRLRMAVYWLVTSLFALGLPLGILVLDMARFATELHGQRTRYASAGWIGPTPVTKAWLASTFPMPHQSGFYRLYLDENSYRYEGWLLLVMVYLAWPWLTVGALLVFQISMRRARVKAVHVARCVVYTFDAVPLSTVLLPILGALLAVGSALLVLRNYWGDVIDLALAGWVIIATALFVYRLTMAYRLYLQFRHSFLTVLTSQVLVALFLLTVILTVANILHPVRS